MKARHFWWAALVVLLAGGVALAQRRGVPQTLVWNKQSKTYLLDLVMGQTSVGVDDLCPLLSSMGALSGDYFCLSPDGTSTASSAPFQLSAQGTPTTDTRAVCSNGPDCATRTGQRLASGARFATPDSVIYGPSGNQSLCAVYRRDSGTAEVISRDSPGWQGGISFRDDGANISVLFNSAGVLFPTAPATASVAAVCLTYQYVGPGNVNVLKVFVNGTLSGTKSDTPAWPALVNTQPWSVGACADTSRPLTGVVYSAFVTQKLLTDTEIATLSNAALGAPPALLTYTRTGERSCSRLDGSGLTWLAANKPCIANGGLLLEQPSTVPTLYNTAFDNAAWAKTGGGGSVTVTANSTAAPDGTLTADTLAAASAVSRIEQYLGSITGTTVTVSLYVRSLSGTQTGHLEGYNSTIGAIVCTANFTATTDWQRVSCTGSITSGNQVGPAIYPSNAGAGTVVGWCPMVEAGSIPSTACIRTEGTAVTRAGDLYSVPTPSALSTTEGCARVVTTPLWTGAVPSSAGVVWASSGTNRLILYENATGTTARSWNGTTSSGVTAGYVRGTSRAFRTEWSASGSFLRNQREDNSTTGSTPGFTAWPAWSATIHTESAAQAPQSLLHRLTLNSTATGCQ